MSFFDYLSYQWTKGDKNWHIPYNDALQALKDFLGDKGSNASLGVGVSNLETEVAAGRDGKATLLAKNQAQDVLMLVAHNGDGTEKVGLGAGVDFTVSGDTPTFVSSSSFTVPTDKAATYIGRRLMITLSGGAVYATVKTAVFSSVTTITIEETNIDNTISAVSFSIIRSGATGSIPAHPHTNNGNGGDLPGITQNAADIFVNTVRDQEDHGKSVLNMEEGYIDELEDSSNIDTNASSGQTYDVANALYKNTPGGAGLTADFPFTTEANYIQKEEGGSDASISGDTVTIAGDVFGANVLGARFSVDNFATEAAVDVRTDGTHIDLPSGHGLSGTNVPWKIRFIQFDAGVAKLNSNGLVDITSGETFTAISVQNGAAAAAFDNNPATIWAGANFSLTGWIAVEFSVAKIIVQYTLGAGTTGDPTRTGKNWTFEYSDNGSTWFVLDTVTNQTGWVDSEVRTFSFSNSTAHLHYRIKFTAINGGAILVVAELEMMDDTLANVINEVTAVVPAFSQLKDIEFVTVINDTGTAITSTENSQSIFHAIVFGPVGLTSYANDAVIVRGVNGGKWKSYVRHDSGAFQINTNTGADDTTVTWVNAAVNDLPSAIAEAVDQNAVFQMTGAEFDAITLAIWAQAAASDTAGGFLAGTHTKYGVATVLKSTSNWQNPQVDLIRTNWDANNATMDLRFNAFTVTTSPNTIYLFIVAEETTGTLIAWVSRDGGATWVTATLVEIMTFAGSKKVFRAVVDMSAVAAGTDIRPRLQTAEGDDIKVHAYGIQGRAL